MKPVATSDSSRRQPPAPQRRRYFARLLAGGGLLVLIVAVSVAWRGYYTSPIDSFAACMRAGYPVAESYPPTCRAGRHTFIGPRSSPAPSATPSAAQPFELLVDGDSRGNYPQRQEVITDQSAWQRYWREIHANITPLPPILPVNFATQNVIALSAGPKSTGGYSLRITDITTASNGTVVDVTETAPGPRCVVTQAISNRYLIVRTTQLTQPVSFRISNLQHGC